MTWDWPLIDHLWMGWLPQDVDEANRLGSWGRCIVCAAKKLQVLFLASATLPERWVDAPPLMAHAQLLAHTNNSLGNCGRDKLLSTLCGSYWWPIMHTDIADCVQYCLVYQWDKQPALPKEEIHWTDKGGTPLIRWSINMAGLFPQDDDGNCYLLVAIDPFSKWVETYAVPLLHS